MTHHVESTTTYKDGFGFFLFNSVLTVIVVRFVWDRYSEGLLGRVGGAPLWVIYLFFIPVYKIRHRKLVEGLQAYYYYYFYPALCSSALCECLGKNDRTHTHAHLHKYTPTQACIYISDSPINIYETLTYNVSKPPHRHRRLIYIYKILVAKRIGPRTLLMMSPGTRWDRML